MEFLSKPGELIKLENGKVFLVVKNIEYKKSLFPISALGKAYADDKIDGFIKILANEKEILGCQTQLFCIYPRYES